VDVHAFCKIQTTHFSFFTAECDNVPDGDAVDTGKHRAVADWLITAPETSYI